jgi:hypothetical protein
MLMRSLGRGCCSNRGTPPQVGSELRGNADGLTVVLARRELHKLAWIFNAPVSSFERKLYANLSHAPNKAMNLNAYIGLIGGAYNERPGADGRSLEPCDPDHAELVIPEAEYLLTLDADSVVLPEYALKLVATMLRDPRVAVAQTPYSAFPARRGSWSGSPAQPLTCSTSPTRARPPSRLLLVGANALLRYRALKDIETQQVEREGPCRCSYKTAR